MMESSTKDDTNYNYDGENDEENDWETFFFSGYAPLKMACAKILEAN